MLMRRCSIAAGHRFVRTATFLLLIAIGCAQNEVAHETSSEKEPAEPFERYEQVTLSEAEQDDLLRAVRSVLGYPYVWGGDSVTSGFDCSGLIQWAYRELGMGRFRNGEAVYREIAAHELYQYNTLPLEDIDATRRGDFVFFDVNGDGRITHNAVLDRVDEKGQVWVYDAYSVAGAVVYRTVEDFWDKGPRFGRPLKTIPRAPADKGHARQ
jgi:cell wall-associated NlpC family hydrolase